MFRMLNHVLNIYIFINIVLACEVSPAHGKYNMAKDKVMGRERNHLTDTEPNRLGVGESLGNKTMAARTLGIQYSTAVAAVGELR